MTGLVLLVLAQAVGLNVNVQPLEVRQGGVRVPTRVRQWAVDCSGGATCSVDGGVWYLTTAAGGGGSGLPADPAACPAGQYVTDQNASGVLTCSTPPGTYVLPDSTNLVTGGVRLTGDLSGTATSPAVVDDSHNHTSSTISALDTADTTTGTWPAARGGLGAAQPTCSAGDFLTCNGTTCSCSTPSGSSYTLPAATATVLGGVKGTGTGLTCSGTNKATGFAADGTLQCGADLTGGGGGGGNWGTFTVSFGTDAGLSTYDSDTVTVAAAWVTGTSNVVFAPACSQASGGVTPEECRLVAPVCSVVAQTASTSFDVSCTSTLGGYGPQVISYTGN